MQVVAQVPPLGHALSYRTSMPGITPVELYKDYKVIIKLGLKEVI
jgi:hypothetical protein